MKKGSKLNNARSNENLLIIRIIKSHFPEKRGDIPRNNPPRKILTKGPAIATLAFVFFDGFP